MKTTAEEFIARKTLDWENERRDGKAIRMKDVGREAWHYWVRGAGSLHAQADGYPCVFSVERLRYVKTEGTPRFPYGPLRPHRISARLLQDRSQWALVVGAFRPDHPRPRSEATLHPGPG